MSRFLLALPVALLLSYSLVGMMAWMVDLNNKDLRSNKPPLRFDVFVHERDQSSARKDRTLPDPPEKKPQPPKPEMAQPQLETAAAPALEAMPQIKLDLSISSMNIAVPISVPNSENATLAAVPNAQKTGPVKIGQTQNVMPLHRIEPIYPRRALQRKIQGFVVLSFDIDPSGRPQNVKVKEANPARVFNREALKALKRWKYQPMMVNGEAKERIGQLVRLEFKIQ